MSEPYVFTRWGAFIEASRWWLVALLPRRVASFLWCADWLPLGSWAPYIMGQASGIRGVRMQPTAPEDPND